VDPTSKRVLTDKTRLHQNTFFFRADRLGNPPVYAGKTIRPSPHFIERLQQFKKSVAHLERIELGRALKTLHHRTPLDSPVGNLVTDAMRATDGKIDVAMYNSGGLRTSILAGVITYGRVYEVVPFDNNIVTVSLSGAQIRKVVEHGLAASYGVMEISGLQVVFDGDAPRGRRCLSLTTNGGKKLEDKKIYTVATNDFVMSGGDGYYVFSHGVNIRNTHKLIREVVAHYIKKQGIVTPAKGGRYRPGKRNVGSKKP